MTNKNLVVDSEKCVHCGLCVKDCIAYALEFDENKVPKYAKLGENRCISCQHCLAVCPVGAISILDKNPQNSESIQAPNPENLLNLIKSRRSIRHYKNENLSVETMQKLKNMLNWVPTGCNFHQLHFSFVEDVVVMDKIRNYVTQRLIKILNSTHIDKFAGKFKPYLKALTKGEDVIFRGAPHMVVVSVPTNAPCASIDPIIALSYFDLYAQSLGVGTCWCGFAQACLQLMPEFKNEMKIPEGFKPAYVMLFGESEIKYSRTTQPQEFLYDTISEFEPKQKPFWKFWK